MKKYAYCLLMIHKPNVICLWLMVFESSVFISHHCVSDVYAYFTVNVINH